MGDEDPALVVAEQGGEALVAAIQALPPLPAFSGRDAINAFWEQFSHIELGTDPAHRASLAAALAYQLMMTDNQFANTDTSDLHESYGDNYGIQWSDPEHVASVRKQQEIGLAYAQAFWELSELVVEYPPLIYQLGEAMHAVAAEIRTKFPAPDVTLPPAKGLCWLKGFLTIG
jgi:hypothetical protein